MSSSIRFKRILLVEDHQFIINVIHELLTSSGFKNVEKATSAELALDMMSTSQYDMIITDVEMGDINGIELLRMIRCGETPLPASTRVIVLTSHANMDVLGAAIALDVNGFLVKPAKLNTTVEKIQIAFDENFKPKKPVGYSMVSTAVIDKPEDEQPEEPAAAAEEEEEDIILDPDGSKTVIKTVGLEELQDGMVTAEPVKNNRGMVLIPSGHTLSSANINRIIEMKDSLESDLVKIK